MAHIPEKNAFGLPAGEYLPPPPPQKQSFPAPPPIPLSQSNRPARTAAPAQLVKNTKATEAAKPPQLPDTPATKPAVTKKVGKASKSSKSSKTAKKAPAKKEKGPVLTKNIKTLAELQFADDDMPIDSTFTSLVDTMRAKFGDTRYLNADQLHQISMGIPLPSLAMCYLLGGDVWPLSRFVELYGGEGSCKSAFLYELGRWFCKYRGMVSIVETENKSTAALLKSIMGRYADPARNQVHIGRAASVQEWMRMFTTWQHAMEQRAKSQAGKSGKAVYRQPCLFAIDSMLAVGSEANLEKLAKDGAAQKNWPEETLLLKSYLQALSRMLDERPWCLVGINHFKPKTDGNGQAVDHVPGGGAPKFHAATRIKFGRAGGDSYARYNWERLHVVCTKSTQGQKKRSIFVEMKWRRQPNPTTGLDEQITYWDWNKSTIEMLLMQETLAKPVWAAVKEIVDLRKVTGGKIWSRTLGIPESDPVIFSEAGRLLEGRTDLVRQLYNCLGIAHYPFYLSGLPFVEYLNEGSCREADSSVERYFDNDPHADFYEMNANAKVLAAQAAASVETPDTAYDEPDN